MKSKVLKRTERGIIKYYLLLVFMYKPSIICVPPMLYGSHTVEHWLINQWNTFWVVNCFSSPLGLSLAQKVIEGCGARRNGGGECSREVGDPRVWVTQGPSLPNPSCCWYCPYEHFICTHRDVPQGKFGGGVAVSEGHPGFPLPGSVG